MVREEEADPVVVRWNCSPVSVTDMFTTYAVMTPFCPEAGGGVQLTCKVLESTAEALVLSGEADGTVEI